MKTTIVEQIIQFYLNSGDFNGISVSALKKHIAAEKDLIAVLAELINEDKIEIMYGDYHPNPHIKAFSGMDKKEQINKLKDANLLKQACVYPTQKVLV